MAVGLTVGAPTAKKLCLYCRRPAPHRSYALPCLDKPKVVVVKKAFRGQPQLGELTCERAPRPGYCL